MIIYLINIALILFWNFFLLYKNPTKRNKKIFCSIVALQWTLISGLRHVSIGADTAAYEMYFEQAKSISWRSVFENLFSYIAGGSPNLKDPGYVIVEKVFQIFSGSYQLFLLFIGALFSISLAVWVYKNSDMPALSFVIYSTLFYSFFAITGHRQTIATALIVLIGYKYIKKRNFLKFALLSFFAYLVHKSALVFVPFYFIANIPISLFYVILSLISIFVITLLGNTVYIPIVEFIGYDSEGLEYNEQKATTFALVLLAVCIIILVFYPVYKNIAKHPKHIFNVALLTILADLAVFNSQGFMRVQQYYSLFIMISIPDIIKCIKGKKNQTVISAIAITVLIAYLISNNPNYTFFFA